MKAPEMYRTGFVIFFLFSVLTMSAQDPDGANRKSANEKEKNLFLLSLDFANNSNAFGDVSNDIRQPSYSPSFGWLSKWKGDFLVSGSITDNSDDSLERFSSELDLMFGYNFKPHKNLVIYPSFSYFMFSSNTNSFISLFNSELRLDADYSKRFFNAGITTGYLMGNKHTFYTALRNYYQIEFSRIITEDGTLFIQPEVDIYFGSYEYLNRFYLDQLREDPYFYFYLLKGSPNLSRYVLKEKIKNPELSRTEIIDQLLEKQTEDSFKLTSVNLNMSVMIILGNAGINFGIFGLIPVNQPEYLSGDVIVYLTAGITWSFNAGK